MQNNNSVSRKSKGAELSSPSFSMLLDAFFMDSMQLLAQHQLKQTHQEIHFVHRPSPGKTWLTLWSFMIFAGIQRR
jgi:hypothetical protein